MESWEDVTDVSPFDYLVCEAKLVVLEERLRRALAELRLVTEERDMALLERDRLEHRLAIAHGEGDRQ
jgi:hypothetical protein